MTIKRMDSTLKSTTSALFLAKFWGPFLCGLIAVLLLKDKPFTSNVLLALPFVIATLFGLSVATLEVRGGTIRYRRLFAWKVISREEIIDGRVEWGPLLGSIRLKKLVFPWGRIYFVLDENLKANPFREGEFALLNYIRDKKLPVSETSQHGKMSPALRQVVAGGSGALLSALMILLKDMIAPGSQSVFSPTGPPRIPPPVDFLSRVSELMATFQFQFIAFAVFAVLAVVWRHERGAWITALLAGMGFPYVVFRLLKLA